MGTSFVISDDEVTLEVLAVEGVDVTSARRRAGLAWTACSLAVCVEARELLTDAQGATFGERFSALIEVMVLPDGKGR